MIPLIRDGGVRSRKLWLAAGTSAGIVLVAVLCACLPPLIPLYDTAVGGLIGVFALYSGANIGAKHVLKNASPAVESSPQS